MHDFFISAFHEIINKEPVSNIYDLLSLLANDSDSYTPKWHALGFIHCKLASFSQGTLRLHIWPPVERHSQEQSDKIHDHIFSLTSFVICGSVKNEIFEISEVSEDAASNQCYEVKYFPNGASLQPTGNYYNKSLKHKDDVKKNEHYVVMSGDLHQSSTPNGALVATLVATYDHIESAPRLLGSIQSDENLFRQNIIFERNKWVKLLASIKSEYEPLC